jgi:protein-disulfide isomerase
MKTFLQLLFILALATSANAAPVSKYPNDEAVKFETFYGAKNAPVVIEEYASLSCPHCAQFYKDMFSKIKTDYIIPGKVYWVLKAFPLNLQGFRASQIVECVDTNSKKQALTRTFFSTQESWAFGQKDEATFMANLAKMVQFVGINERQFKFCVADKKVEEGILAAVKAASKRGVKSTPAFYINGKYLDKVADYKDIKKVIDAELAKKK